MYDFYIYIEGSIIIISVRFVLQIDTAFGWRNIISFVQSRTGKCFRIYELEYAARLKRKIGSREYRYASKIARSNNYSLICIRLKKMIKNV